MRYMQYLRYLPFVVQLIALIRAAERDFPDHGTGPQKLEFVVTKFGVLIDISEQSGIVSAQLAQKLRDGAEAIINLIVGVMNDTGGIEPAPPAESSGAYDTVFDMSPKDSLYVAGDRVMRNEDSTKWRVEAKGAPVISWGAGWVLDHVVR